jgi:hypothetical protein
MTISAFPHSVSAIPVVDHSRRRKYPNDVDGIDHFVVDLDEPDFAGRDISGQLVQPSRLFPNFDPVPE